jgi:hypothetical protein
VIRREFRRSVFVDPLTVCANHCHGRIAEVMNSGYIGVLRWKIFRSRKYVMISRAGSSSDQA